MGFLWTPEYDPAVEPPCDKCGEYMKWDEEHRVWYCWDCGTLVEEDELDEYLVGIEERIDSVD